MTDLDTYIRSGILEAYIEGRLQEQEKRDVEEMASVHPEVRSRLDQLSLRLEEQALAAAVPPPKIVKAVVMASIDFLERKANGEPRAYPPILHEGSDSADYDTWLNRSDFQDPPSVDEMHIKIIAKSHIMTTAVVWMQEMTTEVHQQEIEQFLVLKGTCEVLTGDTIRNLQPGDFMKIGPGILHRACTTSPGPCKAILQRILI